MIRDGYCDIYSIKQWFSTCVLRLPGASSVIIKGAAFAVETINEIII